MGTKTDPGPFDCWQKAEPDEPLFVLLARDRSAPMLVRLWAELRTVLVLEEAAPYADRAQIMEAIELGQAMDAWRKAHRK